MFSRSFQSLSVFVGSLVLIGYSLARPDDADDVKSRVLQAKKAYDADFLAIKKAIASSLDKWEVEARKAGDIKLIERVQSERSAFEKSGDLPTNTTDFVLLQISAARTSLDAAYTTSIQDCLRLKATDAASAIDTGYKQFLLASASYSPVKCRLNRAKIHYADEIKKYREEIESHFDKLDEAARKKANLKLLEQIKTERLAFGEWGELPRSVPTAIRKKPVAERTLLEKAYATAIKDYLKIKQDNEAAMVDKEHMGFTKLQGTWRDGDRGNIFVFKFAGNLDEYIPTGKQNTTGEWRLDADNKVTIVLKNGFKLEGLVSGNETIKADVFGPESDKPIITIALRRIVK